MKIVELRAENIKGIKAVEITPAGDFVEIAGKNGAGKSSVLDAIWLALGGKDASKDVHTALRNGQDSGYVELTLDSGLVVRRNWVRRDDDAITTSLKVTRTDDGITSSISSPQTTLDALRAVALDPAGFIALTPVQQRDALLQVIDLDLDLDEWAAERKRLYEERTELGRQGKSLGDVPPIDDDLPKVEQSAAEIIRMIQARKDRNSEIETARKCADDHVTAIKDVTEKIQRLQAELEELRTTQKKALERVKFLGDPQDTGDLEQQLEGIEDANAKIRANNQARELLARKAELRDAYEAKTAAIGAHDRAKEDALAKAQIGLEGVSIGDDGITYDGVNFQDLNSAAQIEVAFWILAELNPRLRIVQIRQGSLLDADAIEKIKALAAENDFQVWIETVGTGGEDAVVISDGEVVA